MPSVSVIVPVYGVEQYIARCARSLFGQTLRDIEYIFIDDCSPDNSMGALRRVLEEEFPYRIPQVKIYRMPQNSGQAKVRMQGISMVTGEYVIHCDSDDEVDTDAYRQMYEVALNGDFDIVTCDFIRVYSKDNQRCYSQVSVPGNELTDVLYKKVWATLWCRLMKRSLLMNLVPPQGDLCEDVVITCQAICQARRFGYVQLPLYHYFVRESSIMFCGPFDKARNGALENSRLLVRLLYDKYLLPEKMPAVVYFKYQSRSFLLPFVHVPGYYKRWKNIFPEIDRYFLFTRGVPFETKFWFVLVHCRLYHFVKKITGRFRRRLNNSIAK